MNNLNLNRLTGELNLIEMIEFINDNDVEISIECDHHSDYIILNISYNFILDDGELIITKEEINQLYFKSPRDFIAFCIKRVRKFQRDEKYKDSILNKSSILERYDTLSKGNNE